MNIDSIEFAQQNNIRSMIPAQWTDAQRNKFEIWRTQPRESIMTDAASISNPEISRTVTPYEVQNDAIVTQETWGVDTSSRRDFSGATKRFEVPLSDGTDYLTSAEIRELIDDYSTSYKNQAYNVTEEDYETLQSVLKENTGSRYTPFNELEPIQTQNLNYGNVIENNVFPPESRSRSVTVTDISDTIESVPSGETREGTITLDRSFEPSVSTTMSRSGTIPEIASITDYAMANNVSTNISSWSQKTQEDYFRWAQQQMSREPTFESIGTHTGDLDRFFDPSTSSTVSDLSSVPQAENYVRDVIFQNKDVLPYGSRVIKEPISVGPVLYQPMLN